MKNFRINKLLFVITGLCALVSGAAGVFAPGMYDAVVAHRIMPGVYAQDIFALASALILIVNALWMKSDDYRKVVVSCGVLGFFFYAFGIFAIEQVYTPLYPLYLTILALSFYSIIYALASLKRDAIEQIKLPRPLLIGAAGYGFFIAVLFNVIWLGQLVPLLQAKDRIEYTFSIYIIDLVFIMPGFAIAGTLALQKKAVGLVALPSLFILGTGILAPLALAELLKQPLYGKPMDTGGFLLYGTLSLVFLILTIAYLIPFSPKQTPTTHKKLT